MIDIADIFTITVPKKISQPRRYRATWPCGATWEFDRFDLELPEFEAGEQNGITHCYSTIREAMAGLTAHGCKIERISA